MRIGIIGAMNEEIIELKEMMEISATTQFSTFTYYEGKIGNREVVLVESGIGKVNAAVCSTILINNFKVDQVIFTGVAGAVDNNLNIGDVVVSVDLVTHDFDCTAFGMKPGEIPRMDESVFRSDERLMELAYDAAKKVMGEAKATVGRIVSGDQFIASKEKIQWLGTEFGASAVEMEGAAVAHVCKLLDTPFVIIRALSDKADGTAHMDFKEFVFLAAKNSKDIVLEMLKNI